MLGEFLGLEFAAAEGEVESAELRASDDGRRLSVRDTFFRTPEAEWLTLASLPERPLAVCELEDAEARVVEPRLPVLYGSPPYLRSSDDGIELGIDVFGSVFFLLTRYEEAVATERDEHGRFPAAASLAVSEDFARRPLANEYVEILWSALARLWPSLERRDRTFRELPSHDVDLVHCRQATVGATVARAAKDIAFRRDPRLAFARLRAYASERDPFDTFDELMERSERRGLRSAFYFMTGDSGEAVDGDYSIDEPSVRAFIRRIGERGHEVGLHPSYGSSGDAERTRAEFQRLRAACEAEGISQAVWGGRQHFLRWENPATWQAWEDAGLDYDSTLAFPEQAGFRAGCCYEYPVFNLRARQALRLRERPLVVMDASLIRYQRLSPEEAVAEVDELRRRCRLFDGDFTLLWHNDWLYSRAGKRLHERMLGPG